MVGRYYSRIRSISCTPPLSVYKAAWKLDLVAFLALYRSMWHPWINPKRLAWDISTIVLAASMRVWYFLDNIMTKQQLLIGHNPQSPVTPPPHFWCFFCLLNHNCCLCVKKLLHCRVPRYHSLIHCHTIQLMTKGTLVRASSNISLRDTNLFLLDVFYRMQLLHWYPSS